MTDARRYQLAKKIFEGARSLDHAARGTYLDEHCAGDDELLLEVETLLRSHDQLTDFLDRPALGSDFVVPQPSEASGEGGAKVSERFGHFTIVRLLGEGGMGSVYEAQQDHPRRTVALKIIKSAYATKQLRQRFELETQALARLHHPGIAQIFEAGSIDAGGGAQPYFAMEYIDGATLLEYAKSNGLGTRQRLQLMAKICDAVQHAHQRGIIHRDLKPGNIIVDASGQPKILDFGVARATDSDVQTVTLRTDIGQLVGTVPYMSPEQAGGDPFDIDVRSDVYALGVLLYELLTDKLPHNLAGAMIHEAVRRIREDEPTPLSTYNRTLRGDVETIVLKALEKDKTRRYQSARELEQDLQRYLDDEPISARPPTTLYQLSKFARRNKTLVGGVVAVIVVLVIGVVSTSFALVRARDAERLAGDRLAEVLDERDRALAAERDADAQRTEAVAQSEIAQSINDFLNHGLLGAASPTRKGPNTTVRELLDQAAIDIESGEIVSVPRVEASIRNILGSTYMDLGLSDKALPQLVEALELNVAALGPDHDETLAAKNNLALLYAQMGRYAEAEPLHKEVLELRRQLNGPDDYSSLVALNNVGSLYYRQRRISEAEPIHRECLERRTAVLGEEHPETIQSAYNLALCHLEMNRFDSARDLLTTALETSTRVLGPDDVQTLETQQWRAFLHWRMGELDQAAPMYEECLRRRRVVLGEDHPKTLGTKANLALVYNAQGRYDVAEPLFVAALDGRRRVLGRDHPATSNSLNGLAWLYFNLKRYEEAEPLFVEALELRRTSLGDEHGRTLESMNNLAMVYMNLNRFDDAEAHFVDALAIRRRIGQADRPDTLVLLTNLGRLHLTQGRFSKAESFLEEAVTGARKVLPADHWHTGVFLGVYGDCLRQQQRCDEARAPLLESHSLIAAALGDDHDRTVGAIRALVTLFEECEEPEAAAQWRARLPAADAPGG